MTPFTLGQLIEVKTTFTDDGERFDPHSVLFRIKNPAGEIIDFLESTRDSEGVYEIHVKGNRKGTWWYRTEGRDLAGNLIAVDEGPFEIIRSRFG